MTPIGFTPRRPFPHPGAAAGSIPLGGPETLPIVAAAQAARFSDVEAGRAVFARGQKGPAVRTLQERLTTAGWSVPATGRFGPRTEETVRRFQRDHALAETGEVGLTTLIALDQAELARVRQGQAALSRSSTGGAVRTVQRRLALRETGVYGPSTEAAVREFQSARRLVVDGVVGRDTLSALEAEAPRGGDPTERVATRRG